MSKPIFDTLQYVKILEDAGIPRQHAEAILQAFKTALSELESAREIATKKESFELDNHLAAYRKTIK